MSNFASYFKSIFLNFDANWSWKRLLLSLIFEYDSKHLSAQSLSQPPIFQHRHFQALALEFGIQIGMNRSPHSF